jgi:hypothetical protein
MNVVIPYNKQNSEIKERHPKGWYRLLGGLSRKTKVIAPQTDPKTGSDDAGFSLVVRII